MTAQIVQHWNRIPMDNLVGTCSGDDAAMVQRHFPGQLWERIAELDADNPTHPVPAERVDPNQRVRMFGIYQKFAAGILRPTPIDPFIIR